MLLPSNAPAEVVGGPVLVDAAVVMDAIEASETSAAKLPYDNGVIVVEVGKRRRAFTASVSLRLSHRSEISERREAARSKSGLYCTVHRNNLACSQRSGSQVKLPVLWLHCGWDDRRGT